LTSGEKGEKKEEFKKSRFHRAAAIFNGRKGACSVGKKNNTK
jgi:hypothetical protein